MTETDVVVMFRDPCSKQVNKHQKADENYLEVGFNNIQIYGDYDLSPYSKASKRLIVVAENP